MIKATLLSVALMLSGVQSLSLRPTPPATAVKFHKYRNTAIRGYNDLPLGRGYTERQCLQECAASKRDWGLECLYVDYQPRSGYCVLSSADGINLRYKISYRGWNVYQKKQRSGPIALPLLSNVDEDSYAYNNEGNHAGEFEEVEIELNSDN